MASLTSWVMAAVRRSLKPAACREELSASSPAEPMPPPASAITTGSARSADTSSPFPLSNRGISSVSHSFTAKGAASAVLESIETQLKAIYKNLEETAAKEEPIIKAHLQALFHFLTQKLSNLGSKAHVEVTVIGHKAEGAVHEMDLKIRHLEPPVAVKPVEQPSGVPPAGEGSSSEGSSGSAPSASASSAPGAGQEDSASTHS